MDEQTPAAPAPPAVVDWNTEPVEGDTTLDTFHAEQAEAVATPPPAERQLSKRQRDINDRARIATERATADFQAESQRMRNEIAELREQLTGVKRTQDARPETVADNRKKMLAELSRFADLPDAPKLEEFTDGDNPITPEQFQRYQIASAAFVAQKRAEAPARTETPGDEPDEATVRDIDNFKSQIDAEFVKTLSPDVLALRPIIGTVPQAMEKLAAAPSEAARTDIIRGMIARLIFGSRVARPVTEHLSQHPEILADLVTGPATLAHVPRNMRDRTHAQHIISQFNALEATLSAAPLKGQSPNTRSPISKATPPPRVITTPGGTTDDDEDTAAQRGDFASFRQHRADRLEHQRRR